MTKLEEMFFNNHRILAIAPQYHVKYASAIYTVQKAETFHSLHTCTRNMETYCLLNGSSLEGRKLSSRKCFKDVKNPSILISDPLAIAAFQVPTVDNLDTIWIMDIFGAKIESLPNNHTVITLSSGVELITSLPANLVEKRREKALNLLKTNALKYSLSHKFPFNIAASHINHSSLNHYIHPSP
ncbi:competence protein ComK [Ureibacillus aquaedulcis]|uniref:Competence protein ComK n=1 Tax=Ureibacillus aquaedulcis TaxID=3058421 RepID=A0ABT8GV85_9BACL|nr:competence protein ComK [Ureibacillus sp. BA0131]MDN4495119.1 competence protein ComK [Ureibacillus sp. BA0131]